MSVRQADLLDRALRTLDRAAVAEYAGVDLLVVEDLASAWTTRTAVLETINQTAGQLTVHLEIAQGEPQAWELVELAEQFILDHSPSTLWDAAAILDVLLDGVPTRSDSRDHEALRRIQTFLLSQGDEARHVRSRPIGDIAGAFRPMPGGRQ